MMMNTQTDEAYRERHLYTAKGMSHTVTSRELVWQVPTAARFRSAYLGDRSPNTPFINAKGTAF